MPVIEIKAPADISDVGTNPVLFCAGSIEMGAAINWQERLVKSLSTLDRTVVVLNPRRDDWDSSWVQSIDNPQFKEQVFWELEAMEQADIIAMHFEPETKSPITLLELGLWAPRSDGHKLVVHCPEGFWRRGNVECVCSYYNVPLVRTFDDLVSYVVDHIW